MREALVERASEPPLASLPRWITTHQQHHTAGQDTFHEHLFDHSMVRIDSSVVYRHRGSRHDISKDESPRDVRPRHRENLCLLPIASLFTPIRPHSPRRSGGKDDATARDQSARAARLGKAPLTGPGNGLRSTSNTVRHLGAHTASTFMTDRMRTPDKLSSL